MTVKQELAKKAGNLREKDTKENRQQEMKTEDSVLQGRKDGFSAGGQPLLRLQRADEIECRVGTVNEKGLSILLFKDARVDQKILDETFTPFGWKRTHQSIDGNLYCTVEIWDKEKCQWIAKQDVGTTSYSEKEKGQASDSFKRACFNWGLGRELYHSWYEDKKKSYEEYAEKSSMFEERANFLEGQIKELEQRKSDRMEEIQAEEIKLDIVKMQLQDAMNDCEDVQKQAEFVKEEAMKQYEKYRRVEPSERGTAMFDDMLRLKRENMILKDENRTLKEKLQKAYDFMRQFTFNGLNMLERFLESVGERVQSFSENIGFGGRNR